MNLLEWKQYQTQTFREELKRQMHNGIGHETHFMFSSDELEEMKQEVEIEKFDETVEFEGEFNLDIKLIENHSEVQEMYDFAPDEEGSIMDVELEFDLDEVNLNTTNLMSLKELFFAEDYEVTIIQEDEDEEDESLEEAEKNPPGGKKAKGKAGRAKVIFKRAKGNIKKKKICGPGMRLAGNRCLPQTGTQKAKMRRVGIKLKRAKKAMGKGAKKKAAIKSKITKRRVKGRSRSLANTSN